MCYTLILLMFLIAMKRTEANKKNKSTAIKKFKQKMRIQIWTKKIPEFQRITLQRKETKGIRKYDTNDLNMTTKTYSNTYRGSL